MELESVAAKAVRFRDLHAGAVPLVLPNAWDAGSARVFELAGFPAIATTSAGVAFALGLPDGERVSREEMLAAVRRIAAAVAVPVTADLEAGYGPTPGAAAETARAAIAAGAVGMNLEDGVAGDGGLFEVADQVARIRAVRETARAEGLDFVLNARTDVFLKQIGEPAQRFDHAVRRARAYREAGADCLFVPGPSDADTIGRLVRGIEAPVNVLAVRGTPPVGELARLGVARVSMGSGPMRATLGLIRRIAEELRGPGTYTAFLEGAPSHAEIQRLFAR